MKETALVKSILIILEYGKMENKIQFEILGAVVAKERPRFSKKGAVYTPKKTKDYENVIKHYATEAMKGRKMLTGAVAAIFAVYRKPPESWSKKKKALALEGKIKPTTKPDGDNLLKILCDGMNNIVYKDDAQITCHVISKRYGAVDKVEILISDDLSFC